jgi:hypothetical protein
MDDRTGAKLEEIDLQISELRKEIASGKGSSQIAQIDLVLLLEKRARILADLAWREFNCRTASAQIVNFAV